MLNRLKHKGHQTNKQPSGPEIKPHHSIFRSHSELRKSIWYAFSTLAVSKDSTAAVSTLKVLTSSLGRPLGFETAEEILNTDDSHEPMNFQSYFEIVENNILNRIANSSEENLSLTLPDFEEVHKVCWSLFFNTYAADSDSADHLPEASVRKLWTLFNLLVEDDEYGVPLTPPKIDREELGVLLEAFIAASGQSDAEAAIRKLKEDEGNMDFMEFKKLFFNNFAPYFRFQLLCTTLETVYEEYVDDILEKGLLSKKGHQYKNWKERWMVLKPDSLRYYTGSDEREMKGCIQLHTACTVEVITDKGSGTKPLKPNRFILSTNAKPYEMSAADIKSRNDWVKAIQLAIDNADKPEFHYHKLLSKQRQQQRKEKQKQKEAEEARRLQDEETIRKLTEEYNERHRQDEQKLLEHLQALEAEKSAREELESKLLREAALREVEQRRLRELQEIKRQLEKLLNEERQAKKDEEIVRALQARLYEEECEKREELEKLKREQEELLQQERQEREDLLELREKQERLLEEAQNKLEQLEIDRAAANSKLEEASSKLQLAEKERSIMEAKVKLWKTPIGLARPVEPKVDPHVTHRGLGAFCEEDFKKSHKENTNGKDKIDRENDEVSDVENRNKYDMSSDDLTKNTETKDIEINLDVVNHEMDSSLKMENPKEESVDISSTANEIDVRSENSSENVQKQVLKKQDSNYENVNFNYPSADGKICQNEAFHMASETVEKEVVPIIGNDDTEETANFEDTELRITE